MFDTNDAGTANLPVYDLIPPSTNSKHKRVNRLYVQAIFNYSAIQALRRCFRSTNTVRRKRITLDPTVDAHWKLISFCGLCLPIGDHTRFSTDTGQCETGAGGQSRVGENRAPHAEYCRSR